MNSENTESLTISTLIDNIIAERAKVRDDLNDRFEVLRVAGLLQRSYWSPLCDLTSHAEYATINEILQKVARVIVAGRNGKRVDDDVLDIGGYAALLADMNHPEARADDCESDDDNYLGDDMIGWQILAELFDVGGCDD